MTDQERAKLRNLLCPIQVFLSEIHCFSREDRELRLEACEAMTEIVALLLREKLQDLLSAEEADRKALFQRWAVVHGARLGRPELARAAREERDVESAVWELVEDLLRTRMEEIVDPVSAKLQTPPLCFPKQWYGESPRGVVPTREAYAIYDALVEGKESLGADLPATVKVSPICRVDVAPEGFPAYRTAVIVRCGDRGRVAVLTEPLNYPPPPDEDDEY